MLVYHDQRGRKWFNRSTWIPDRWFPKDYLDSHSYAIDLFYSTNRSSGRELVKADTWFDCEDAGRYDIYEDSLRIRDGVLSILVFDNAEMLDEIES